MNFVKSYTNFFKNYFPSPFSIAIILSLITFILALIFNNSTFSTLDYIPKIGEYWFKGMFNPSLLSFTIHMMLILVLGHVIALTETFQSIINYAVKYCTNTANSTFIITLLTILVAMFNWGLGLIFGAIFARKIGEHFQRQNKKLNYPLVAASAYVGLMVWHGGLSGSASLAVASETNTFINEMGILPTSETIFSYMNIFASISLIIIVPLVMYFVAKKSTNESIPVIKKELDFNTFEVASTPAEKIETGKFLNKFIGILILVLFIMLYKAKINQGVKFFNVLNLEMTNLLLFGLALTLHKNISMFLKAVQEAIGDVSGILIQFPLYFGILGIIQESGLAVMIAEGLTIAANEFTLPLYTFISSGIINMFVPSGGGQWQVQGPIIIETAKATGTSLPKMIMALAYGDQLTNMLQPFWALPLLAITGLKAKDILPYTLILFLCGFCIFMLSLIIF